MINTYDLAIIGAGPAGIMAAIFASRNGSKVILLEKNDKVGRKILATGNGRCNLTNANVAVDNYYGDKNFISSVLARFDQNKTIAYFESLGLILKEEDRGRIFPRTNQASSIVDALSDELNDSGVEVMTDFTVRNIAKSGSWSVTALSGEVIKSQKLLIATGGKAAFHLGSSGDGLFWASKLGHTISPIHAALVPIETVDSWPKEAQGIKLEVKVSAIYNNKVLDARTGDLIFTHFGVSGPSVMALAATISPLLEKGKVILNIDLFPELSRELLDQKITTILSSNGAKTVKNALIGIAPANLLPIILRLAKVDMNKKTAEISKFQRQEIINILKAMPLTVSKVRPLKEAQVTSGGIKSDEVNFQTLESKIIPSLYFAGEILDVHGDSGGFNLQWAWSTAYVAGMSASKL